MTKALSGLMQLVVTLYVIGASGSVAYFNWNDAKEHGFVSWIFFGEIVPTLKSAAWPYFLYHDMSANRLSAAEKEEVGEFVQLLGSLTKLSEEVRRIEATSKADPNPVEVGIAVGRMLELAKVGETIDLNVLEKVYPQLGTNFSVWVQGQRLLKVGYEERDSSKLAEGLQLEKQFLAWYESHLPQLIPALQKAVN